MKFDFLKSHRTLTDMRELDWPQNSRMLVLAPHPDDFDAIGVTMKFLHGAGHDIHVAVSVTGSGIDPDYGAGMTLEEKRNLRINEQIASLRFFDLPEDRMRFMRLENAEDDQLLENDSNFAQLTRLIGELKPDVIFSPHGNDTNRAHRAMYTLVSRIADQAEWPMALMLNRDAKTIDMRTDVFIDFDEEEARWKAALLRIHDSQHQRNLKTRGYGFDERVLGLNKIIAKEISSKRPYAAVFEVHIYDRNVASAL